MQPAKKYRLGFWRGMFYLLLAIGLVITWVRFTQGIGAVTNLSDKFPWGLWVGFDLLCGIGLAAGSFVIVAVVYIFNLKRFEPLVRPALLTGFLGYLGQVEIAWGFMGAFSAVAIVGILIGAYLVRFVPQETLRRAFAVFLIVMGAGILYQNRGVWLPAAAAADETSVFQGGDR